MLLVSFIKRRKIFIFSLIFASIMWTFSQIHPYIFRSIAAVIASNNIENVESWLSFLPISPEFLLSIVLLAFLLRFMAWISSDITGELCSGIFLINFLKRIVYNPTALRNLDMNRVKGTLTRDFKIIRSELMASVGDSIGASIDLLICLVFSYFIDARLILVFIPILIFFYLKQKSILRDISISSNDEAIQFSSLVEESLNFIRMGTENLEIKWLKSRFQNNLSSWVTSAEHLNLLQVRNFILQAVCARPILLLVIILSTITSLSNDLIGAVITGAFLLQSSLSQIGYTFNSLTRNLEAYRRWVDLEKEVSDPSTHSKTVIVDSESMRIRELLVSRNNNLIYNARFDTGRVYRLFGPSGFGKSTLLEAISGIVDSCGEININGYNFNTLSAQQKWENCVLLMPSCPSLDLQVNKLLPEIKLREILNLSPEVKIHDLSVSRRALVYALSAIYSDQGIVLLDEPLSEMDENDTLIFIRELSKYIISGNKICIIISHQELPYEFITNVDIREVCRHA